MSSSLYPLLALGTVGFIVYQQMSRRPVGVTDAARGGPQPLFAGTPYLFNVRLDVPDDAAREVLESKGAEMLVFASASQPPFWALTTGAPVPFSTRVASFKATPQGNGTVTLGEPFYGIGRLESVARLDGRAFAASSES